MSNAHRIACCLLSLVATAALAEEPLDIGTRRELFVDDYLLETMKGDVSLQVQQPRPEEVVLVTDRPWEGNTCAYYTIFEDDGLFRMYYRGSHANEKMQSAHREVTCYAESRDGIHWERPNLGIHEWEGSKENNIILDGLGTHCFVAFKDGNPAAPPEAKYKGISAGKTEQGRGLFVFQSADAIHWELITDKPVITKGAFDSQNLAYWDPYRGHYTDYHRVFSDGVRAIMTATSKDFLNWSDPVLLKYQDGLDKEHLYTNAIRVYDRAPHLWVGFPTRFSPKNSQVEPIFMSSRDGLTFRRFQKAVIPPSAPKDRDGNRSNYLANALLELPRHDDELAVYGTEAYYTGPDSRLRRFMYRVDGFVALEFGKAGGEVTTPVLTTPGNELRINYRAAQGGEFRVELRNADNQPIEGYTLSDCQPLRGDEIEGIVKWREVATPFRGEEGLRLHFSGKHVELFAVQFLDSASQGAEN